MEGMNCLGLHSNQLQSAGLLTRRGHSRVATLHTYLRQEGGVGTRGKRRALTLSNAVAMNESLAWTWQVWRQSFTGRHRMTMQGQVAVPPVEYDHSVVKN